MILSVCQAPGKIQNILPEKVISPYFSQAAQRQTQTSKVLDGQVRLTFPDFFDPRCHVNVLTLDARVTQVERINS